MRNDERVTQELVATIFDYDSSTGLFKHKKRRRGVKQGSLAGSLKPDGYVLLCINGLFFQAARVAWLYVNGVWPTHTIDHINRVRSDNRISNLRDVTPQVNSFNIGTKRKNNTSGCPGVYFFKRAKRYHAQISIHGKTIFLGAFVDIDDAAKAYAAGKQKYHAITQ